MLVPRSYIDAMAARAAKQLLTTGAAEATEELLRKVIASALAQELTVEDRLRDEARKLAETHRAAARSQGVDLEDLMEKIVQKLARERRVVLR